MIKIIQIGEGNFLRTFVDAYFDNLNKNGFGQYEVNIVKPISIGSLEQFRLQNNKYHIVLRGVNNGRPVEDVYSIDCVKSAINPFDELDKFYALAVDPDLHIVVSNTTEAGICFDANDAFGQFDNVTYPAKLTQFLYKRFESGLHGLYLMPVELIDNNADELYKCVSKYIELWNLPIEFKKWNDEENYYCNTLVDRIVSGFPKDENTKSHLFDLIGAEDKLVSIGEPFGLWAVEKKGNIDKYIIDGVHNIEVVLTENIKYYKKRKVRVLNGSHTNLVPISLWYGKETVYDVMTDQTLSKFVKDTLRDEIIPFVSNDVDLTTKFADSVVERFFNPYLNHQLTSIALNSISKWKARVLPSFADYYNVYNKLPKNLTIGLAYLINMYQRIEYRNDQYVVELPNRLIEVKDDLKYMIYFQKHSVTDFLQDKEIWDMDLTIFENLLETISKYLELINRGQKIYE